MGNIVKKKGFTLIEVVLSCAIISIFMLGSATILTSSAKVYILETRSSGARGAIETAADDIKNYMMSGNDMKLLFYMDGIRTEIILRDGTSLSIGKNTHTAFIEGTIFYTDGKYKEPDGTTGTFHLTDTQQQQLSEVAEGIDLGYRMIYIDRDNTYIRGLPYSKDFYRGMTMALEISEAPNPIRSFYVYGDEADVLRKKKQNLYTVRLTGKGKDDIYMVTSGTAVVSMNDPVFH